MTISAKIIADSISDAGIRLTTMELRYPRFIHAELMTHRVFSRNASSSRATPVKRMIQEIQENPAMPIHWGLNQKGMQALSEAPYMIRHEAQACWITALMNAVKQAEVLVELGLHKQIVNRLLEPFAHMNVVVTSTEWDNFYKLRRHPDAQPEIKALADRMWEAHQAKTPFELKPGDWHLPYIDLGTWKTLRETCGTKEAILFQALKVSTARCARVSYVAPGESTMSIEKDLELYQRLVESEPVHASPAEHQATPDSYTHMNQWKHPDLHGNFRGWVQHRKVIETLRDIASF